MLHAPNPIGKGEMAMVAFLVNTEKLTASGNDLPRRSGPRQEPIGASVLYGVSSRGLSERSEFRRLAKRWSSDSLFDDA